MWTGVYGGILCSSEDLTTIMQITVFIGQNITLEAEHESFFFKSKEWTPNTVFPKWPRIWGQRRSLLGRVTKAWLLMKFCSFTFDFLWAAGGSLPIFSELFWDTIYFFKDNGRALKIRVGLGSLSMSYSLSRNYEKNQKSHFTIRDYWHMFLKVQSKGITLARDYFWNTIF